MNKSIHTLQNEDKILKCLVRQRELYNYAKLINNIYIDDNYNSNKHYNKIF